MSNKEIVRALFVLTRDWVRHPDSDDVAGEIGCNEFESDRIWDSILEARAAHAMDYLTCHVAAGQVAIVFPSENSCPLGVLGSEVVIGQGNLTEAESKVLRAVLPSTLSRMCSKALAKPSV